jgi:hypothetical protein
VFEVSVSDIALPWKLYVWPADPVTVYVHWNEAEAPGAREAIVAGTGPDASILLAVPPNVRAEGVTLVSVAPELFVTVNVTVTVPPDWIRSGVTLSEAVKDPIRTAFDVAHCEKRQLPESLTELEKVRLPDAGEAAAVHVQVKTPDAPAASVKDVGEGLAEQEASEGLLSVNVEEVGVTVADADPLFCTVI